MDLNKIIQGDALSVLKTFPDKIVQCTVTSPPYWGLRSYGTTPISWPAVEYSILGFKVSIPEMSCELGHEEDPKAFIGHMVLIFREVHRVLRDDGTLWLNIGDSYAGSGKAEFQTAPFSEKQKTNPGANTTGKRKFTSSIYKSKDLIGIPWMLAFALRDDGWYLRQDNIWSKPNPMPESVTDRCTKSHEYIFHLSKSPKYYFDQDAIRTPITENTVKRMNQQIENQKGSDRAFGGLKHNGPMKAVGPGRNPRKDVDRKGGNQGSELGIKAYSHRLDGGGDKGLTGHSGVLDKDGNLIGGGAANKKSVWTVTTKPFSEAHFATFPEDLIVDCIKAGSKYDDIILDPFMGAGTTAIVARKLQRNYLGIELNQNYINIANKRQREELGLFL